MTWVIRTSPDDRSIAGEPALFCANLEDVRTVLETYIGEQTGLDLRLSHIERPNVQHDGLIVFVVTDQKGPSDG